MIIFLALLFLASVAIDWIQFREELEDMRDDEEFDELQGQQDQEGE